MVREKTCFFNTKSLENRTEMFPKINEKNLAENIAKNMTTNYQKYHTKRNARTSKNIVFVLGKACIL